MAVYEYRCPDAHLTQWSGAMGEAPQYMLCDCAQTALRVYGDFQFQEDRYRFFRNPVDGGNYSYSLGREHPDNRTEYHRACAELGTEPVTRKTMPRAWKEDQDYREHVAHGGKREEHKPGAPVGQSVLQQMQTSKTFRVG